MPIALTVALIAAVPGVVTALLGVALWPPTRRLNRLDKLALVRSKLHEDSNGAQTLDEAIENLALRVLNDTIGKTKSEEGEPTAIVRMGVPILITVALIAAAVAVFTVSPEDSFVVGVLPVVLALLSVLAGGLTAIWSGRSASHASELEYEQVITELEKRHRRMRAMMDRLDSENERTRSNRGRHPGESK